MKAFGFVTSKPSLSLICLHAHKHSRTRRPCDLCGAGRVEARGSYGALTTVSVVNGPVLTVAVKPQ